MAKNNKADMSCARVKKYTASDVSKAERHNERKNETYENMNVIEERIPYNVHFKKPFAPTYMEQLKQMEADGMVSLRGLRKDATLFNEIVIDVNTMYFERNGGYEYAKQFYEEAFHFIEEKFGAENVISAVMHADEINVAASEELGKEIANQMIGKGADVLFIYANKVGNGCIEAAKENGVKVIGFSENQNDLAPGTVAASIKFDFGKIYSWILDHYMDGKLNGNEVYGVGIEEEIFIPIFTDEVPKEVQQTVENNMK